MQLRVSIDNKFLHYTGKDTEKEEQGNISLTSCF